MAAYQLDKLAWQKEFMKADLTPSERVTGFVLSVFANAALNQAYPSVHLLAWRTGLTHDTVKSALRGLASKGWITLVAPGGNQYGKGSANTYALTYPATPVYRPEPARRNAKKGGAQRPPSSGAKGGAEPTPSAKGKGGNEPAPRGAMNLHEGGCSLPPLQGIEQVIENRGERAHGDVGSAGAGAIEVNDPTPAAAFPPPPPRRCPAHVDTDTPPLCGPCGDARRAREAWDREHAQRHAEQAKQQRAADRAAAAAVRAAAVSACGLCDADGYVGTVVCDHDPGAMRRPGHGAALFAAEQANRRQAERAAITDADKDALCPACSLPLGTMSAKRGIHADCANRSATPAPTGRL